MRTADQRRDVKLLGWLLGGIVLLLVGIAVLKPRTGDDDPLPSTTNAGSHGAKAAFLMLQSMGRTAVSWDEDSAHLALLDAPHTTLVLAEPEFQILERREVAERLKAFMDRGGRVLLTGATWAGVLPGGQAEARGDLAPRLCDTAPEGPGELAAAGSVQMENSGTWSARGPQFRAEQRCVGKPVVVRLPVGAGEAIWWSSASPLTNSGLKNDGNLRLLLASVGSGRAVYFDEFYYGQHEGQRENPLQGLPLKSLLWQLALLCALLLWSFSRRKGPLRLPVTVPRSSPLEFARSMGGLYGKANATEPVVEASERRLERLLGTEAGLSHDTLQRGPEATAEALAARFGGDWTTLRGHMEQARGIRSTTISPRDTLTLVRAMAGDEDRLRAMLTPAAPSTSALSSHPPASALKGRRFSPAVESTGEEGTSAP